jgi:MFS family permease
LDAYIVKSTKIIAFSNNGFKDIVIMDLRNRIGLYGSYFLGLSAIGFTLPYLPLYLGQKGLSDRTIGLISTLAALSALAQFPVGIWSDRIRWRKPFLMVALSSIALATMLLRSAEGLFAITVLVVPFAENGVGRAVVECLSGAEATVLAQEGQVGAALGALRFWKPVGIISVAILGRWMSARYGVASILIPLAVLQVLAVGAVLLIHDDAGRRDCTEQSPLPGFAEEKRLFVPRDPALWAFVAAMLLFHSANAPAGVYLGLFLKRSLGAADAALADAFIVSMIAWMIVVWPAGWLADRWGRRPLLILGWLVMALRLAIAAVARTPNQVVMNQALDGLANGLFAVLAAAWVTDRLDDPRRMGEAQVLVGCSLVLGSAIGPAISGYLVASLGYRGLFALLAGVGLLATFVVVAFVPETRHPPDRETKETDVRNLATVSNLSDAP